MGNRNDGSVPANIGDGLLDLRLRHVVQRAGRLVQHQHLGILQQRPGNGEPLPLAAGKVHAIFVNVGIIALGHRLNIPVYAGHPAG